MTAAARRAPRTGKLARSAIAAIAGARVGAAQLRRRLSHDTSQAAIAEHEAKIGRILFAALAQMRGTALKVAQVLSLDSALLSPGVRAELAKATHRVTPLNRALVGRVFRVSFGCEPEALFENFEPAAFAAASLGQVHRATMHDGTQVAVKIQYPGIAATIDTDLRLLRSALANIGPSVMPLPDPCVIDRALDEVERQLHEEVDYRHEAEQQRRFKALNAGSDIVIADVIARTSTKTVLTQEALPGLHLDAWLATNPPQALRNRQGQAVFDWFVCCAFRHRRIHADLHPGNFLFMDDGRVGVLDFGCTRELSPRFVDGLARSWQVWLSRTSPDTSTNHASTRSTTLLQTYRELGLVDPALSINTFETKILPGIEPLLNWVTEPFTQPRFDFARKSLPPVPDLSAQGGVMQHLVELPPEMLSIDRAWLGLMHLLRRLGATVDTTESLQRVIRTSAGK